MAKKRGTGYAFLDTNLHLQFNDFDQIDWPSVLEYEDVCLVVAPVTFSELEKFKYDPTSDRRRSRSRAITSKINTLLSSAPPGVDILVPGRPRVTLRVLTDSADMSPYSDLQQTIPDDQLLASILKFTTVIAPIDRQNIILVSEDGGLLNKARARGIAVHVIAKQFRLPDEPTTGQREIARLETRIAELENKQPKLSLALMKDNCLVDTQVFQTDILPDLAVEEINRRCEIEASAIAWPPPEHGTGREVPGQERPTNDERRSIADALGATANSMNAYRFFSFVPQEELGRYEKEEATYLDLYRQHVIRLHYWRQVTHRMRQVEIAVVNVGSVPATGIIVQVVFPEGLQVIEKSPEQPKPPVRPQKPMTAIKRLSSLNFMSAVSAPYLGDLSRRDRKSFDPDTAGPTITPSTGTLLGWKRSKAVHHLPTHLTPLLLVFPAGKEEQSYSVSYKLFADNLANPTEGTLTIGCRSSQGS